MVGLGCDIFRSGRQRPLLQKQKRDLVPFSSVTDPLLEDVDNIHAAAIAALPPFDASARASVRVLARSNDHFADKFRATIRGGAR